MRARSTRCRWPGWMTATLLAAAIIAPTAQGASYALAFWNVENLFDTTDDPAVSGDEEFTPTAPKAWSEERFRAKLKALAQVIVDMNDGRGPDVLGLAEVENRFVVEQLVEQLKPLGRDYDIVHKDSPSGRGIDCALLYDRKALRLDGSAFLTPPVAETRDVVEARLAAGGDKLFVFVNHWPSRMSDQSGAQRSAVADMLRKRIDELLSQDAAADIVVIGDLNDHPGDTSVAEHLHAASQPSASAPASAPTATQPVCLLNTTWAIHASGTIGSYNYQGKWEIIDHVILSPGLLDAGGFAWKAGSTQVFVKDYMLYKAGTPEARPNRTYSGRDRYFGGYSDHLPVVCVVERAE